MCGAETAALDASVSDAKVLKLWVAPMVAMAARAAMCGCWPTVTWRRSWHFEITRTDAEATAFTVKAKTSMDDVVKTSSSMFPKELSRVTCTPVKSWPTLFNTATNGWLLPVVAAVAVMQSF
jgi:hypothetical protein